MPVFTPFDKKSASEREYELLSDFLNVIRKEQQPDHEPTTLAALISLAENIQNWRSLPDFIEESDWLAWDPAQTGVIGYGEFAVWHTGDNEHVCLVTIFVHPQHRRRGIGRALLARAAEFARKKERTLMITLAYGRIPAGEQFLCRVGARPGLETSINQLKITDVPAGWVEKWVEAGERLGDQFEIGMWDGPLPEEHLGSMVAMIEAVKNDRPRDQMEVEDEKLTPEIWRQKEKQLFARGSRRWMVFLRERTTGNYVGMTDVNWHPNRPAVVIQGFTAVRPEYRGQGLGRWLKAAMLDTLLRGHPETRVIRTQNASSNAPMLKINEEMGFKPYSAQTVWQVEREKVERYLAGKCIDH